jgi:hypothetical protein
MFQLPRLEDWENTVSQVKQKVSINKKNNLIVELGSIYALPSSFVLHQLKKRMPLKNRYNPWVLQNESLLPAGILQSSSKSTKLKS